MTDSQTGSKMTVSQAVDAGVIDAGSIKVKDPQTGDLLSFDDAIEKRILDPVTGDIISPDGEALTLKEAVHSGLAIVATTPSGIGLTEAVMQGLYSPDTGKVTDPTTGQELTLKEAIEKGLLDPSKSCVVDHYNGEMLTIEEAVNSGLIDLNKGTMEDPVTGKPLSLGEAIVKNLLTAPTDGKPSEATGDHTDAGHKHAGLSLEAAIQQGLLDAKTGTEIDFNVMKY